MTTKQPRRTAHALIIGINRYTDPAAANLPGARNDAIAYYKLCRRDLRIPAANITVAASPPFTAEELGHGADKATLMDATGETLRGAIKALSSKLTDSTKVGLMTYSGHGVVVDAAKSGADEAVGSSLAICPSDTANGPDGSVTGAIDYFELHKLIGDKARENLTVILDTCNNGVDDRVAQRHFLGPRVRNDEAKSAARALLKAHPEPISSRVLVAVDYDQVAREIETPSGWRGAFSHCLCLVLQRWRLMSMNGIRHYEVNHEELLYRVRRILNTLSVGQRPQLLGSGAVAHLPVFKPGLRSLPGDTSREPNRKLPGSQFPITTGQVNLFVITSADGDTSYWFLMGYNNAGSVPQPLSYSSGNITRYLQPNTEEARESWWRNPRHEINDNSSLRFQYSADWGGWSNISPSNSRVQRYGQMMSVSGNTDESKATPPTLIGGVGGQDFDAETPSDGRAYQFMFTESSGGSGTEWYLYLKGNEMWLGTNNNTGLQEVPVQLETTWAVRLEYQDSFVPGDYYWYKYSS